MSHSAEYWIDHLDLRPHPEGGWFRETMRGGEVLPAAHLPARYGGERSFYTGIHYLLQQGQRSRLHRLASDEIWHYCAGDPLEVHRVTPEGDHDVVTLGPDPEHGQAFQAVVPAGVWFGASLPETRDSGDHFCLVSCFVAPGFDFADFEMASREQALELFPHLREVTELLT